MRLPGRSNEARIDADASGPWSVSDGEYDGKRMLVRLNDGLRAMAGRKSHSRQAGIAIRCNSPDEQGLPSANDATAFSNFEDQSQEMFCADQLALFAAVITTGGMREFVFYLSDERRFREHFRDWARTPKSHRVQLMIQRDPSWSVYRKLAARRCPRCTNLTSMAARHRYDQMLCVEFHRRWRHLPRAGITASHGGSLRRR